MSKAEKIKNFDPNGVGLKNGHFIGLPFTEEEAEVVLLSVPWDVTTSYSKGTAGGPQNILDASPQLDLLDYDVPDAWKMGLYLRPADEKWMEQNQALQKRSEQYIDFLENGGDPSRDKAMQEILEEINRQSEQLKNWVKKQSQALLDKGKLVGVVGGEHSVPLGLLEALAERNNEFGILQIDAHMDLRRAYEGFTYSHASISYNALQLDSVVQLTQVGIRDFCEEELQVARESKITETFFMHDIRRRQYRGHSFSHICGDIIRGLPDQVYISFDIDGLDPRYCPNTGTPVPGGLEFDEAAYLLKRLIDADIEIIGFDLCEVAGQGHEWDGNVGARVLYKLANLLGASRGRL